MVLSVLIKGCVTALAVAALLLLAQARGRRLAGLLAGLPTVTGPALAWLVLDQGAVFAAQACAGAVAAGAVCGLFALGYGVVSRHQRWPGALGTACALAALALPVLELTKLADLWGLMGGVTVLCGACLLALPDDAHAHRGAAPSCASRLRPLNHSIGVPAAVSGAVSAAVCAWGSEFGAFWAGVLSSPPLIAGIVAVHLHGGADARAAGRFLRGYTAGLIGRSAFAALLGALLLPFGGVAAGVMAMAGAALLGWAMAHALARSGGVDGPGRRAPADRLRPACDRPVS
jgi:hypothetical protein